LLDKSKLSNNQLIETLSSEGYPVSRVCKVLSISRSSYYSSISIKDKEERTVIEQTTIKQNELLEKIKEIKADHLYWGYRRIWAYLKYKEHYSISPGRVYRLMKTHNLLVEVKRYKAKRTPQKEKPRATEINQWWGIDMTKFYINSFGWVYLVIVIDWYSKMVVGYKLNVRSKSDDWIEALQEAIELRCPKGSREYSINLMSDNGSQPTSLKFESFTQLMGINHITTSYCNPKGNAETERFMRTLKEEIIYQNEFDTFEEAASKVKNFINYYNQDYLHSSLNYLSPVDFETKLNYKNVA